MSLPCQSTALQIPSQEIDYGSGVFGSNSLILRAPICKNKLHPLEEAERSYRTRQEEQNLKQATRTFGQGFAMHLRHEQAAVKFEGIGHMSGVLPRSNAMYDSLTCRDLEMDFSDTLALDIFDRRSVHDIMERRHAINL